MQKRRSYAEVYNDRWDVVVNVFRVMRDPGLAGKLEYQLRMTPFSRTEFNLCGDQDLALIECPIERARRTIIRSFMGFGSAATNADHATGFRASSNRSGTTAAHDWANYPNCISMFTERLKGVVIENRPYHQVLKQQDTPETLHYLDPPYVHATRNMKRGNAAYAHEFTDQDHIDMSETVKRLKGMVIISGYDCELYQEIFKGWKKITRAAKADGARDRIECLWLNDRAANLQINKELFP